MNTLYLITGAAGHLGSTVARQLAADMSETFLRDTIDWFKEIKLIK